MNFCSSWHSCFHLMYFQLRLWDINGESIGSRENWTKQTQTCGKDEYTCNVTVCTTAYPASSVVLSHSIYEQLFCSTWALMEAKSKTEFNFLSQEVKLQDKNSSVASHPDRLSPKIISVISFFGFEISVLWKSHKHSDTEGIPGAG